MKTIEALLAEGRKILRAEEDEQRQNRREYEQQRQESWQALALAAFGELGELAENLPTMPPEDFRPHDRYGLTLTPFAAPALTAWFTTYQGLWQLTHVPEHYPRNYFRVVTRWELYYDDDDDDCDDPGWTIRAVGEHDYESLPLALVAAQESSRTWRALAEEMKGKPTPTIAEQPPQTGTVSAPLRLTDAEERLILALRDVIEEGREK